MCAYIYRHMQYLVFPIINSFCDCVARMLSLL